MNIREIATDIADLIYNELIISTRKAILVTAGAGLYSLATSKPIPHQTAVVIIALAIADAAAYIAARRMYRAQQDDCYVLAITNPDGSPYKAPWGPDTNGIAVYGRDDLDERLAAIEAAGLVATVHRG